MKEKTKTQVWYKGEWRTLQDLSLKEQKDFWKENMKPIIKTAKKENAKPNWLQNCPLYKEWQAHPENYPRYNIFRDSIPKCTFECALTHGCKIG